MKSCELCGNKITKANIWAGNALLVYGRYSTHKKCYISFRYVITTTIWSINEWRKK